MRLLLACAGLLFCGFSLAESPWQKLRQPLSGPPQSIGAFANGCIIGTQQLPLQSTCYQVLHQDLRRYYGHPKLLQFIQRLSSRVHANGLGQVLVGDMSMAAGGNLGNGHVSHQTGLEVDIPLELPKQRWSKQMLLKTEPLKMVSADGHSVNSHWRPETARLIKLAAEDEDVVRLFVAPAIKAKLCADAGDDRSWLWKVRPWYGHTVYIHIRLRCPSESPDCLDQPPPPLGDGCGAELNNWLASPHPGSGASPFSLSLPLYPACKALLERLPA